MEALIARLKAILPAGTVLEGGDAAQSAQGWSNLGMPCAVLRPACTAEVSQILQICHQAGKPIVPWGGKTGLVDGAFAGNGLALSMERMNKILAIDQAGATATVEAGCILQSLCDAVEAEGLLFPLDLGSRGSATIGGNISTNAGGNRVIRFGMMREMVLGLEVVLADGTVVNALNHLIKNNAGYDLKHIFIGSEGTLGIVTRAVLRLRAKPVSQNVALAAVADFSNLPKLLRRLENSLGGTLSAFEVMWEDFYKLVTSPPAAGRPPLAHGHPYYVLIESLGGQRSGDDERFADALADAIDAGDVVDAVIAKSQRECDHIWALRDDVGQALQFAPIFAFDVSLPISEMEKYVTGVRAELKAQWSAIRLVIFGHLGDGNLHLLLGVGDASPQTRHAVEEMLYRPLGRCGGSISAEHGIGLQKRDYLEWSRSAEEIALMRIMKRALDPTNILNPGKVFETSHEAP